MDRTNIKTINDLGFYAIRKRGNLIKGFPNKLINAIFQINFWNSFQKESLKFNKILPRFNKINLKANYN